VPAAPGRGIIDRGWVRLWVGGSGHGRTHRPGVTPLNEPIRPDRATPTPQSPSHSRQIATPQPGGHKRQGTIGLVPTPREPCPQRRPRDTTLQGKKLINSEGTTSTVPHKRGRAPSAMHRASPRPRHTRLGGCARETGHFRSKQHPPLPDVSVVSHASHFAIREEPGRPTARRVCGTLRKVLQPGTLVGNVRFCRWHGSY